MYYNIILLYTHIFNTIKARTKALAFHTDPRRQRNMAHKTQWEEIVRSVFSAICCATRIFRILFAFIRISIISAYSQIITARILSI